MNKFFYKTSCVNSTADKIQDMIDQSREITYKTFIKKVDRDNLISLFPEYEWFKKSNRLLWMKDDYAVRYYKSKYENKPCYYLDHSAIEYVFVQD